MNNKGAVFNLFSRLTNMFESKNQEEHYKPADVYVGLRNMVFDVKATDIGLEESGTTDKVWGVVMDFGYPEAVMTLVALADGRVSIYFSNGGGIIGLGQHDGPNTAMKALLGAAPQFLKHFQIVDGHPLPRRNCTRFYLLTYTGTFGVEAGEANLRDGRHELAPLFYKCHELITEVRLVEEERRAERSPQP